MQRRFLLAIWGIETPLRPAHRDARRSSRPWRRWPGSRAAPSYFRSELFDALTMVQRGHIEPTTMTGSWAGAMGQTQFMPSSYLKYAVDFDGDGRRDIWKSTARRARVDRQLPEGIRLERRRDVGPRGAACRRRRASALPTRVPKRTEGCYAIRNMTERRPLDEWQRARRHARRRRRRCRSADIDAGLVDVGERKFLVYPNYDAILGYNCAHYYALTVALLGDSLR